MIGFPETMNVGHTGDTLQFIATKKCSIPRYTFIIERVVRRNKPDSLFALTWREAFRRNDADDTRVEVARYASSG
jgi:hypothetical protein